MKVILGWTINKKFESNSGGGSIIFEKHNCIFKIQSQLRCIFDFLNKFDQVVGALSNMVGANNAGPNFYIIFNDLQRIL